MSARVIWADTAGGAWLECLAAVLEHGEWVHDGQTRLKELLNVSLDISSIDANDPILAGFADPDRIALMALKYSSMTPVASYKTCYGALLRDNQGVNQLEWAIGKLRGKPETKSATIGFHTPGEESLSCISLIDFKWRHNKLNMSALYRSQNVYASQPGNILALRAIQCEAAEKLGIPVGTFSLIALSAHVYKDDLERAQDTVRRARAEGFLTDALCEAHGEIRRHFRTQAAR